MVIDKIGESMCHGDQTYTVGGDIFVTDKGKYNGLFGTILEIRDGDDKDTANDGPDIYCSFEAPALPSEVEGFVQRFKQHCMKEVTMDDICLDMVIMAPEMIIPMPALETLPKSVRIFMIAQDWAENGETGHSERVFADYLYAKKFLNECLRAERRSGCLERWLEREDYVVECKEDSFEIYQEDDYCENHYYVVIKTEDLPISEKAAAQMISAGNLNRRRKHGNGNIVRTAWKKLLCGTLPYLLCA